VAASKPLQLKQGRYVFRVKNQSVPYELGFWLRGASVAGRVTLPSTSGGGLTLGKTQDDEIALKPPRILVIMPAQHDDRLQVDRRQMKLGPALLATAEESSVSCTSLAAIVLAACRALARAH
jgi:hypothetical protein